MAFLIKGLPVFLIFLVWSFFWYYLVQDHHKAYGADLNFIILVFLVFPASTAILSVGCAVLVFGPRKLADGPHLYCEIDRFSIPGVVLLRIHNTGPATAYGAKVTLSSDDSHFIPCCPPIQPGKSYAKVLCELDVSGKYADCFSLSGVMSYFDCNGRKFIDRFEAETS